MKDITVVYKLQIENQNSFRTAKKVLFKHKLDF